MPAGNSIHAVTAMNALHSASFQNGVIRGSIWDPSWGDDHTHPNAPLFGEVEWYLTCRQVAHAGDTFNTYCQSILAEILRSDLDQWGKLKSKFQKFTVEEVIERLNLQLECDGKVREILRKKIRTTWCNEMEIIAVLRNKIVHQAGIDPEGKLAGAIKKFPPGQMHSSLTTLAPDDFPVDIAPDGKLIIDAKTGYWAAQHVLNLIHLMDQNLCARFSLKRSLKPIQKHSFKSSGGNSTRMLLPGTPLPQPLPVTAPAPSQPLESLEFPPYEPMADPKEQACAKTWHRVTTEINDFVHATCDEVGVRMVGGSGGRIAGTPRSDTLEGHDRDLNYKLQGVGAMNDLDNELGVRLRQTDFEPYVTIWSTNTQMKDYRPCELSEAVKAHLIKSIQQTVSG